VSERKILVVEDDAAIREGLADALRTEGYRVVTARNGHDGLHLGLTEDPDLIVLDIMLPGLDGFEILERLRSDQLETPVLMLTARGLERDRVRGLDLGADDYVVKPFGLAELLARVRSRLRAWDRERGFEDGTVLRFGGLTVDFAARKIVRDGEEVHLSPREFDLLEFLARNEGKAVRRTDLLDAVWAGEDVVSRVIDTAILGLRKKVERDPANPRHIAAVRGVGYRFSRRP
jgi:DNA-binding response OmpR family regulator